MFSRFWSGLYSLSWIAMGYGLSISQRINLISFIYLLCCFCLCSTSLANGYKSSSVVLHVEKSYVCVEYGELLDLVCNLTIQNRNETAHSWTLSWLSVGTISLGRATSDLVTAAGNKSVLTSRLRLQVNWTESVFRRFSSLTLNGRLLVAHHIGSF